MGTSASRPPSPVTVHLTHVPPRTVTLAGYVASNNYTLEYTMLKGKNDTVQSLLTMAATHGAPTGARVVGVRRPSDGADSAMLSPDTVVHDGERLEVVVG